MHQSADSQQVLSHAALVDNAAKVKWHLSPGARPLALVKGNAYGHGLDTAAKAFLDGGFQELGVADINEAITLRQVRTRNCRDPGLYPCRHGAHLQLTSSVTCLKIMTDPSASRKLGITQTSMMQPSTMQRG